MSAAVEPAPAAPPAEDKFEIVQLDESGEVVKTLHDAFDGWMAARTEFGKTRNSDVGLSAKADNNVLQLRVNGVVKMTTAPATAKKAKKRAAGKDAAAKPKKAAKKAPAAEAAAETPAAKAADDGAAAEPAVAAEPDAAEPEADADAAADDVEMVKLGAYAYFSKETRPACKAEVEADAANAGKPHKEMFGLITKAVSAKWNALDDAAKAKWKADAPLVPKKAKKGGKAPKAPKAPKAAAKRDTCDKAALAAKMEADGWKTEETARANSAHKDRLFVPPDGSKKLRSLLDVARAHYPDLVVAGSEPKASPKAAPKAAKAPKKAAAKAAEKPAATKSIDEYYLGATVSGKPEAKAAAAEPENPFLAADDAADADGDAAMPDAAAPAVDTPGAADADADADVDTPEAEAEDEAEEEEAEAPKPKPKRKAKKRVIVVEEEEEADEDDDAAFEAALAKAPQVKGPSLASFDKKDYRSDESLVYRIKAQGGVPLEERDLAEIARREKEGKAGDVVVVAAAEYAAEAKDAPAPMEE